MDKLDRSSIASADVQIEGAEQVAMSVERDFGELVAIFSRQLASVPDDDCATRRHIKAARSAAERGLRLSRELIETLRR